MRTHLLPLLLFGSACHAVAPMPGTVTFASQRQGEFDLYEVEIPAEGEVSAARPVVSTAGLDYQPTWTADGRVLLWESRTDRVGEIMARAGGGAPVEISRHPGLDASPAPSPDGRRLAFVSDRDNGKRELYVMGMDGSGVVRLTFDDFYTEAPAWSPDGEWIAFSAGVPPPTGKVFDYGVAVMRIRPDGTQLERLTPDDGIWSSPSWSPDSRRLVCHGSRDGTFDLWILDIGNGHLKRVMQDPADDRQPEWSPDGKWIAFTSVVEGNSDVYIIHPDGSGRRRLTTESSRDECPTWRPPARR
jgi:TolB protein